MLKEVRTEEGTFTAKQMMERFMLPSDLQSVPIGKLSGGERRRRYLLSILMDAPNVLLPDELTNDLDIADMEEKIEENQKARAAAGADYVRLQELSEEPKIWKPPWKPKPSAGST